MANTVDKVLAIAKAEVGYLEKKSNSDLDSKTANAGSNNYTKYWRDLDKSLQGNAWCNCFVNWCFTKAYGEKTAKSLLCTSSGWSYYTPTSASYFKNKNQWHTSSPKKGDVIYFKNSTRIHHVGIVYKVDSSYVYTYEGNTSSANAVVANGGGVFAKKYSLSNSNIAGYGRPKYDTSTTTTTSTKKTYSGTFPSGTLKKGSSGTQVKYLQKFLNWYGNYGLTVDGDFGSNTEKAVEKFQDAEGLTVDGIFGAKSLAKAKAVKK
jgi:hypothetical protein